MFAYCGNNPIIRSDYFGRCWLEEIGKWFSDRWDEVVEFADDCWYDATYWHYEGREELNQPYPTYEEVNRSDSEWILLPQSESVYHDNGIGLPEEKYTHPDGREAVFNGDTHEPVTDPSFMATYNYVSLYKVPAEGATFVDYLKCGTSYAGHFFADVIPYWMLGNTR